MVFVHPHVLWLLPILIPIAIAHRGGRMVLPRGRAAAVVAIRMAALAALILALARPVIQRTDRTRTLVAVVDASASIDASALADARKKVESLARRAAQAGPPERFRLVLFDATAREVSLDEWRRRAEAGADRSELRAGSALASALELAGALIPHDGLGRVVAFTDGLQTGGDAEAAAARLAERGIPVEVVPIGTPVHPEVAIRSVTAPAAAAVGSTTEVLVEVEATETGSGAVVLEPSAGEPIRTAVELRPGRREVACRVPLRAEGLCAYRVRVESAVDTRDDNNELPVAVLVKRPRVVRVLEDAEGSPATTALVGLLGPAAKVSRIAPEEISPQALSAADVLVIADTPAEAIPPAARHAIVEAVRSGLGLLMTGGPRSFGPGGYADTPIAEVLPVDLSQKLERRDPSTTLVVIIDTSGSMGGARVDLAKEIARLAIARLKPHDKVGIVEFYGSKRWAAPIQPASNAIDLQRALNRLASGGGTVILPALEEAYYALRNVRTRTRHVLVLTDGGVESGAFEPLIRRMAEEGITLSTVLVGPELHSAFLTRLANWGRGRSYSAPDRFHLPEVIVKQPESSLLSPFVEREVRLVGRMDPILDGIDLAEAPPIHGYVEAQPRPTAEVPLASEAGHPILARWHYGLGAAGAYLSQIAGPWTRELAAWPPYSRLVSNLMRSLAATLPDEALHVRPLLRPGAVELQITNRRADSPHGFAELRLDLTPAQQAAGPTRRWTLDPVRPHEWNLRVTDLPPGVYRIDVRTADGALSGSAALAVPAEREFAATAPDLELIAAINARRDRADARAAELSDRPRRQPTELWPATAAAGLVLLLLNVLVRRLPIRTRTGGRISAAAAVLLVWLVPLGSAEAAAQSPGRPGPPAAATRPAGPAATTRAAVPPLPEQAAEAIAAALKASPDASPERVQERFAEACRLTLLRDGSLDSLVAYLSDRLDTPRAALLMARAARMAGDLELARTTLQEWAARPGADARILAELAQVEELLGEEKAALETIDRALAAGPDRELATALRVRQALLLYGTDRRAEAAQVIRAVVSRPGEPHGNAPPPAADSGADSAKQAGADGNVPETGDSSWATFCAHIAALNGDYETAVNLLRPGGTPKQRFHGHLFRGLFLLRLDRPSEAQAEFEQAWSIAPLARDRQFALDRIVAAARQGGRLEALADAWLADPRLSTDRLRVLLAVLRELGRADDALRLLQRPPQTPQQRELMDSPDFHREAISVAVEAGRLDAAEAAYRALIDSPQGRDRPEYRADLARLKLLSNRREEAVDLFVKAIDATRDPGRLMTLAHSARQLALDDVALRAARKAGAEGLGRPGSAPTQTTRPWRTATAGGSATRPGRPRISSPSLDRADAPVRDGTPPPTSAAAMTAARAALFEADLLRERGQTDRAIALLRSLRSGFRPAEPEPAVLLLLAETFERYGDSVEALELLQQLYARTRSEDVLLRVAWLLEESRRLDEAMALWKDMWRSTQVEARLRQAQERLLDLASRTGRLADLAIEIEERLDRGEATDRDLSLLVDIYVKANDAISAAEILHEYARRSGRQVEALQRLAKVYLACEQFGRCNATLRRLAAIDPANATDYLREIAIVALERRQPHEARAALAELTAAAGHDETVDEFSAGVLNMVGLHEEAAAAYGRTLARHPDRIEGWLLWGNAMKAAGRTGRAVATFQHLVEEAAEDDLFTVAVDGLLNLEAKPSALRAAYRRVCARIASRPEEVFLYQLAQDLLEALNRPQEMQDVLEQSVVVAGERRGPLLRELMDAAAADGRSDQVIRFGRSLLTLELDLPPSAFLTLGEAMIREGQMAEARRVFDRAAYAGDFSAVYQRVASLYEAANMPGRADEIIRELLITEPDSVPLLIRSGNLCEQLGRFDRAFEQHYRATDLILRRLPSAIRTQEGTAAERPDEPESRLAAPLWRATNLDEAGQFLMAAIDGLLNSARTDPQRRRLADDLIRRFDQEMAAVASRGEFGATLEANPRLDRLATVARQLAFSVRRPEVADRIDRSLLEKYPADSRLLDRIVRARMDWGLYARAEAFAEQTRPGFKAPDLLAVGRLLRQPGALEEAIRAGALDAESGRRIVPLLIMTGREPEARQALAAIRTVPATAIGETATTMIAAAIAVDDPVAVRDWALRWLEACQSMRDGRTASREAQACVRLVWNHIGPDDRGAILERLHTMAAGREGEPALTLDLVRLRLADAIGAPLADRSRIVETALASPFLDTATAARLLDESPAQSRPDLLRKALAARKPETHRTFLLSLLGEMRSPADARMTEELVAAFVAAPKLRIDADSGYARLHAGRWYASTPQKELAARIAEVLLAEAPNEPIVLAAVAQARANAGRRDEALPLIQETLEGLLAAREPGYEHRRMLVDLARLLTPDELAQTIQDLKDREEIEGATPTLLYGRGTLLEAAGRRDEALAAYREAFRLAPTNRVVSRQPINLLRQAGRVAELAGLLSSYLTKSTIMESYEWRTLAELYGELHNPLAAARAAARDEGPLASIESMRIARQMGRYDDLCVILRRFLSNNRNQGRFYNPVVLRGPSIGGMAGYLATPAGPLRNREKLFASLAELPFAAAEFEAVLQAAPPDRRDVPGLVEALLKTTRLQNRREELVRSLLEAHRAGAMTAKDRAILVALAREDPAAVPEELSAILDESLLYADVTDADSLTATAEMYRARGRVDRARRILQWLIARDVVEGRRVWQPDDQFERIEMYVGLLPESERAAARARWLSRLDPSPLDDLSDNFDAARLAAWIATGDRPAAERQVAAIRRRLAEAPAASRFVALRSTLARWYAALGDVQAFAAEVGRIIDDLPTEGINPVPMDCRRWLPAATEVPDPEGLVKAAVSAVESAARGGRLSVESATRGLCLLGRWCIDNGRLREATAVAQRAEALAGPLGEHWLWVGDLRRACGDEKGAHEIEARLLAEDLLPVQRAPAVLDRIEVEQGREAAARLAARMAGYSDLPGLLERLIRYSRAAGDEEAAVRYERRLRAVSAASPAGRAGGSEPATTQPEPGTALP